MFLARHGTHSHALHTPPGKHRLIAPSSGQADDCCAHGIPLPLPVPSVSVVSIVVIVAPSILPSRPLCFFAVVLLFRPPLSGMGNRTIKRIARPNPRPPARPALVHSAMSWDGKPTRRGEGSSVGRARCVAMQCSMRLCGRPTVPVDTNDRLREKLTLGIRETPSSAPHP